jgi:hypothetical protein
MGVMVGEALEAMKMKNEDDDQPKPMMATISQQLWTCWCDILKQHASDDRPTESLPSRCSGFRLQHHKTEIAFQT